MELTPRQASFAALLLEEEDYHSIGYYAEKLDVTDRTLRDDIKEIDPLLQQLGLNLERRTGKGILLSGGAKGSESLRSLLSASVRQKRYQPLSGRRMEILRELLLYSRQYLSIQKLSDQYYVSRTSIVNDLKYIEEWLVNYHLSLSKSILGTQVCGSETNIRRAFAALIEETDGPSGSSAGDGGSARIDNLTLNSLLTLFPMEDIAFVEALLAELERDTGCTIGEPYYLNLTTHLLICVARVSKGQRVEEPDGDLPSDPDLLAAYRYACGMAERIEEHFDIRLGDAETYYIYQYFASFGVRAKSSEAARPEENDLGRTLVAELTDWVSAALGADLVLGSSLENELLLHVRSMISRMQYGIYVRNDLLPDIQKVYPELLAILEGILWVLAPTHGLEQISPDETAYIAMYCQVAVERLGSRPKIVLVCQSGYGTSQLLKTRISKSFPQWETAAVVSVRQLMEMDLTDCSFVVSTVPLPELPIPHVVISAILSERDIEKLKGSGLLVPTATGRNWRELTGDLRREGCLRITTAHATWQSWLHSEADSFRDTRIAGGRLDATLRLCGGREGISIFCSHSLPNHRALIQAATPEALKPLFAVYCQIVRGGCDWSILSKEASSAELLRELLTPEYILLNEDGADKKTVIDRLALKLLQGGKIADAKLFRHNVLEREAEGSTAIGDGVALPHGKTSLNVGLALAMAVLKRPIPWMTEDGVTEYVDLLVLFAVDPEKSRERDSGYIQILQTICNVLDSSQVRSALRAAVSGEQVIDILTQ